MNPNLHPEYFDTNIQELIDYMREHEHKRLDEYGEWVPIEDNNDDYEEYVLPEERMVFDGIDARKALTGHLDVPTYLEIIPRYYYSSSQISSVRTSTMTRKICRGAFAFCDRLEFVEIVEGVIDIEPLAFMGCPKLRTVKLPESLVFVESTVFPINVEQIVVPPGMSRTFRYKLGTGIISDRVVEEFRFPTKKGQAEKGLSIYQKIKRRFFT